MPRWMRWCSVLGGLWLGFSPSAAQDVSENYARLRFDPQYILERVAQRLNIALRPDVPLPAILLESATPLGRFQDAMQVQWGFRPRVFVNAYAIRANEIYLVDDASHYGRWGRTLDDALAHEFVHYLQAVYFHANFASRLIAEVCEAEAIAVQEWFRTSYVQSSESDPT